MASVSLANSMVFFISACATPNLRNLEETPTPGMGVNLWGVSPLYVNPVDRVSVNTSISRKQGRNREGPSEGSWSAKP